VQMALESEESTTTWSDFLGAVANSIWGHGENAEARARQALQAHLNTQLEGVPLLAHQVMEVLDADQNGVIDMEEWQAAVFPSKLNEALGTLCDHQEMMKVYLQALRGASINLATSTPTQDLKLDCSQTPSPERPELAALRLRHSLEHEDLYMNSSIL